MRTPASDRLGRGVRGFSPKRSDDGARAAAGVQAIVVLTFQLTAAVAVDAHRYSQR